jgi:hypothetical protein
MDDLSHVYSFLYNIRSADVGAASNRDMPLPVAHLSRLEAAPTMNPESCLNYYSRDGFAECKMIAPCPCNKGENHLEFIDPASTAPLFSNPTSY